MRTRASRFGGRGIGPAYEEEDLVGGALKNREVVLAMMETKSPSFRSLGVRMWLIRPRR